MSDQKFPVIRSMAKDKQFPIPLFFEDVKEHTFIQQLKQSSIWEKVTVLEPRCEIRSIVPDPQTPVVYSVLMTEGGKASFILFRFYRYEQDGRFLWWGSNDGHMTVLEMISHLVMAMQKFYQHGHHDGAVSQFTQKPFALFRVAEAIHDPQFMSGAGDLAQSAKDLGKALAEVFPEEDPQLTEARKSLNEKLYPGYAPGEQCNREGCQGIIDEHESTLDGCRCHINPPCAYCTEERSFCPICGWEASDSSF